MSACGCANEADRPQHVKCVHEDWPKEAARFKWIASEKAGYDLGEQAINDWITKHWSGYLRARWVEHLQGTYFWVELDHDDYGLLEREFQDCPKLLGELTHRITSGGENLSLLRWAIWECNDIHPTDRMIDILEAIDINGRRLSEQFNPDAVRPGDPSHRGIWPR